MALDTPLPFTEEFQEAIMGHCLINQRFFVKAENKLKGSWFTKNMMIGNLFDQLCRIYKDDEMFIKSVVEFKGDIFFIEQKDQEREKYYALIDRCVYQANCFSVEKIEKSLTGFLRVSLFKESVEGAARRYKSEGFEDAYVWTKEHINAIQKATFEEEEFVLSFADPDIWINEHELRKGKSISTGNSLLDIALGGGLFKKETCAFMAPVNVGKSLSMITLARHAVRKNHKVLFLIHEGFPEEIRIRILASFLGIKVETVYKWNVDPAMKHLIRGASAVINANLKFVPYIKTGAMFVEDVVDTIKKMHEDEKLKTGRGFDLIIDDYPKKLKSRMRSGSKEGLYRVEAAEIYDSFNHLATELDAHCFVAIQTNRQGLKENNGKAASEFLLGMEEVDESFGIAQNIANIVSLNRSHHDKKLNILRMNVIKSRNSPTDIAINTRTNFACCLTFGDRDNIYMPNSPVEIDKSCLVSYAQEDNRREDANIIHETLRKLEEGLSENGMSGVYVPGTKQ
jgi:KaiC/GvpD/RAD55 family RecA-like ATPase